MTKVLIEKFIDGKHETSFSVPPFVLRMACALLSESALGTMARQGINVREILDAIARGVAYSATLNVREHGINKMIAVSLKSPTTLR